MEKPELYTVPDGYFDRLTPRIMDRIGEEKRDPVRSLYFRPVFMYASAAAAFIIIMITTVLYFADSSSDVINDLTVSISENSSYLTDFLLYDISSEEFCDLAATLVRSDDQALHSGITTGGFSDEEIIEYLADQEITPYEINN